MGGNCFSSQNGGEHSEFDAAIPIKLENHKSSKMSPPIIINATVRHTATVIFLHGLGDTGAGWASVLEMCKAAHVKYICPTAPTMPVSLNMGMSMPSWFDIRSLDISAGEDEAGIKAAAKTVHAWIEDEIKNSQIESSRIVLGGFSQGGALALYSALTFDKPLAAVVALSSWLPLHNQFPDSIPVNKAIPILQCHGEADPLVLPAIGQVSNKYLKAFDPNVTFKMFPGMGHSSCDQELKDVKDFLNAKLPPV